MKITKSQLRQIVKEELEKVVNEDIFDASAIDAANAAIPAIATLGAYAYKAFLDKIAKARGEAPPESPDWNTATATHGRVKGAP